MRYPEKLSSLIAYLKRLPGVGTKTAERFAFELIRWKDEHLKLFGESLSSIKKNLKKCENCGCLKDRELCNFCSETRDNKVICIISSEKDVYSIEKLGAYRGLYHVVELLSPSNGFMANDTNIKILENRIEKENIKEIIIAIDSTLEGDATALFIKNRFKRYDIKISRLAFGLPIGSSLEYIGEETLSKAFIGRQNF